MHRQLSGQSQLPFHSSIDQHHISTWIDYRFLTCPRRSQISPLRNWDTPVSNNRWSQTDHNNWDLAGSFRQPSHLHTSAGYCRKAGCSAGRFSCKYLSNMRYLSRKRITCSSWTAESTLQHSRGVTFPILRTNSGPCPQFCKVHLLL